jgi:hypothetical protein
MKSPPVRLNGLTKKLRFFFFRSRVSFLETFHAARAIDELLFTRIKRMAFITNFNVGTFYR